MLGVATAVPAAFEAFVKAHQKATEVAAQLSQKEIDGLPSEIVDKWRACLRLLLGAGGVSEPPDFTQWLCPLEDDTWDEWLRDGRRPGKVHWHLCAATRSFGNRGSIGPTLSGFVEETEEYTALDRCIWTTHFGCCWVHIDTERKCCRCFFLQRAPFHIRSGSTAALSATDKLAGKSPTASFLALEVALRLELMGIRDVDDLHVSGSVNKSADWLCRRAQPGKAAAGLPKGVKRRAVPNRYGDLFLLPLPALGRLTCTLSARELTSLTSGAGNCEGGQTGAHI